MKTQKKSFLGGVGSIMDIMPVAAFEQYTSEKSASERIGEHWTHAGRHVRKGIEQFENEQKKEKPSAG